MRNTKVDFRVSKKELKEIQELSEILNMTVSEAIRFAVHRQLQRERSKAGS